MADSVEYPQQYDSTLFQKQPDNANVNVNSIY